MGILRTFFVGLIIGGLLAVGWWVTHEQSKGRITTSASTPASESESVFPAQNPVTSAESVSRTGDTLLFSRRNAITKAVEIAGPAVVGVNVTSVREQLVRTNPFVNDPFFSGFFPPEIIRQKVESIGSGFIISKDGYILTADHVIENATAIVITLVGGKQEKAKLIGTDKVSDIALLKIEGDNFAYLNFSQTKEVIIGEWAIAIGNPFGLFNNNVKPSVSVGVVSTFGQDFDRNNEGRIYRDMIQTDAAINSGNSGGPLLNALGEVIGMNTMIYTPVQNQQGVGPSAGVGFAIPAFRLKAAVEMLKEGKSVNRDFNTGLAVQNLDPRLLHSMGLAESTKGVVISDVEQGSNADKAGVQPGDILIGLDTYDIVDVASVRRALDRLDLKVGDYITLKFLHEGKLHSVRVKLEASHK